MISKSIIVCFYATLIGIRQFLLERQWRPLTCSSVLSYRAPLALRGLLCCSTNQPHMDDSVE